MEIAPPFPLGIHPPLLSRGGLSGFDLTMRVCDPGWDSQCVQVPLPCWNGRVTHGGPVSANCQAFGKSAMSVIGVVMLVKCTPGAAGAILVSPWLHLPENEATA